MLTLRPNIWKNTQWSVADHTDHTDTNFPLSVPDSHRHAVSMSDAHRPISRPTVPKTHRHPQTITIMHADPYFPSNGHMFPRKLPNAGRTVQRVLAGRKIAFEQIILASS
jgi:hypothetical protein